jgi:hypothetical protein
MMFHNRYKLRRQYKNKPILISLLGYTMGESVCETCRFPAQLSKKLGI